MAAAAAALLAACDLGRPATVHQVPGTLLARTDVDVDGHADLLVNADADGADLLVGDGAGGFTLAHLTGDLTFPNRNAVVVADANGDGAGDVFVKYRDESVIPPDHSPPPAAVDLLLNDGSGGLGAPTTLTTIGVELESDDLSSLLVEDVNADGVVDLLIVVPSGSAVAVHLGDGSGGFGPALWSARPSLRSYPPVLTDLDGDGHRDLVLSGAELTPSGLEGRFDVLWGDGSGAFPTSSSFPSVELPDSNVGVSRVQLGDFDGDGRVDLVGYSVDLGSFSLLPGTGPRSFGPAVEHPAPAGLSNVATGDLDGDGADDLVVTLFAAGSTAERGTVLFGGGATPFGDSHALATGGTLAAVGDFDEDGRPDVASRGDAAVTIFLNGWDSRP